MRYETDFNGNELQITINKAEMLLGKGDYTGDEKLQLLGYNASMLIQAAHPNCERILQERALQTIGKAFSSLGFTKTASINEYLNHKPTILDKG